MSIVLSVGQFSLCPPSRVLQLWVRFILKIIIPKLISVDIRSCSERVMLMCLDCIFAQKAGTYTEGFDDYQGQLWLILIQFLRNFIEE